MSRDDAKRPAGPVIDAAGFMAATFPGMTLRVPLIGQWPPGIRFTLGGDAGWLEDDQPRIDRIHERAVAIFEACFAPDDNGFVVAQIEEPTAMVLEEPVSRADLEAGRRVRIEEARPIRSGLMADFTELRPYIAASVLSAAVLSIGVNLHGTFSEQYGSSASTGDASELGDDIPYVEAMLAVAPRSLPYRGLLEATANRETPAEPSVSCQLFFINATTGLIYNIPDDRSLHVLGVTSAVLRPLVTRFVDWLESCSLPPPG
jgi:hypothetical protein